MSLCYKILELFEIFLEFYNILKDFHISNIDTETFVDMNEVAQGPLLWFFRGGFVSFADKMTRLCVILVPTWWYIYQADIREIQIYMQKQITFLKKDIFFKYIPLLLFLNFLPSMPHLCFLDVLQHLNCWHVFAEVN